MDDVVIPSKTIEEGLQRLRQVLTIFRKNRLTLRLEKCTFFAETLEYLEYLGREISEQSVRPGRQKIDAVARMTAPQSVKQVRQFLGLASYFRKFVRNFSLVVEPLTRLTRKDVPWMWGPEQREAFHAIQDILTTRPVLTIFDPDKPTEVHTDASALGVGAILLQRVDDKMAAVAYYSRQTTADQRLYHSYELETMAVVFALRYFRAYLLGIQFKVVTDCNALRPTFTKKKFITANWPLVARIARVYLRSRVSSGN